MCRIIQFAKFYINLTYYISLDVHFQSKDELDVGRILNQAHKIDQFSQKLIVLV